MKEEHLKKWISRLSDAAEVTRLVRGHLGCACPHDVFEHYQVEIREEDFASFVQVIIGERLLLWIIDATHFIISETTLFPVLRNGCQERDQKGLNRFRLVLEGETLSPYNAAIEQTMAHFDSRTHIHFLEMR